MRNVSLSIESAKYTLLQKRLLEQWPTLEEDVVSDTLEGITDLHDMIAVVIRSALADEAMAAGLCTRIGDMKQRLGRLEERADKKRQLALEAMSEVGLKKLVQPDFTASTRQGPPALVVVDERLIPEHYWLPQPAKLNKLGMLADLKVGRDVAGAQLSNAKLVLAVRTK